MNLKKFNKKQCSKEYTLYYFTENNKELAMLSFKNAIKHTIGSYYKFGVLTNDGELYWFFNGYATIRSRDEAVKVYSALKVHCKEKDIGQPFAFKTKKPSN